MSGLLYTAGEFGTVDAFYLGPPDRTGRVLVHRILHALPPGERERLQ